MPGTGHSHRFKSSISNRNSKSAFQVLAPWNARKLGKEGQVAVATGGGNVKWEDQTGSTTDTCFRCFDTNNTAGGVNALSKNIGGQNNTAMGNNALAENIGGFFNTATGNNALAENQGHFNTATGERALAMNISGMSNTANGMLALTTNTIGINNTASGYEALTSNISGNLNTAFGEAALKTNKTGDQNTACGQLALGSTDASFNTAVGFRALNFNQDGSGNTAVGWTALSTMTNGGNNTSVGSMAGSTLVTGNNNTCLGFNAQPNATNVSNEFVLGNSNVAVLRCQIGVISGLSDERDKKDIIDIPYGLELINKLQPRQFTWDIRNVADNNPHQNKKRVGFVAQEVKTVLGDDNNILNMIYETNPDKLELSYGQLVPVLTKAIQELDKQLIAEKDKNTTLEARLTEIESYLISYHKLTE